MKHLYCHTCFKKRHIHVIRNHQDERLIRHIRMLKTLEEVRDGVVNRDNLDSSDEDDDEEEEEPDVKGTVKD